MTIEQIRELMEAFETHNLTEFSYSDGEEELHLAKEAGRVMTVENCSAAKKPSPSAPCGETKPADEQADAQLKVQAAEMTELKAPLAGVFYRAAKPDEKPYAEVGMSVKKGQTIGLIEAMKMMSEIPAPCDGTVDSFCVGNGEFVEYGQPVLFLKET